LVLEGFVRRRIAGAAVIAVGLMLALTGCTFFTPQATLIPYDASDGVALNVGNIQMRNVFVVSEKGTNANLVGVIINTGKTAETINIQYTSHTGGTATSVTEHVSLAASPGPKSTISFGNPGVPQLVFRGDDVKPGALLKLFVQYGSVSGRTVLVPVLDNSQASYATLAPSPLPTATPTPTAIPAMPSGVATN
jgi:hypothetical protein